jgi:23S rRNA (pseudouridine1915-N3)-methyltransferase
MKITILCVGKIKEKFYRDAIDEYVKRLGRYCKLEIVEVADEKTLEHASLAMEEQIREKEAERVAAKLDKCGDAYVIALAIDGQMPDSVQLSDKIQKLGIGGVSHIVFLIGGSLGMTERLLQRADERISFSKMTFPHQLMRVILLEQIYRSYRIINGEPYHK